jgi:L-iditol 2-dehydrogenase
MGIFGTKSWLSTKKEDDMKVAALTSLRHVELQERPMPAPAAGEVLIRVRSGGICGSDLHYYEHGKIGNQVVQYPMILGHEIGGGIVESGPGVSAFKVGDLVAAEPQRVCGKCEFCRSGRYSLCPHVKFWATPPVDGAFAEYVVHPAEMVYKLPDSLDTVDGALMEPLAIGFHVANQSEAKIGESAVILGAGTVGLSALMVLKARGINETYVSDVYDWRLQMAMELGAKEVFNAKKTDLVKEIMERTGGQGADMVFEMAGSTITTQLTIDLVKRGGRIVLVGFSTEAIPFDFRRLVIKEVSIRTSRRYRNVYPFAIQAVAGKWIPARKIVTDTFPFRGVQQAMEYSLANKDKSIKTIIAL